MKTLRRIALIALAAILYATAGAAPASGGDSTTAGLNECPNGYVCAWEHANYSGRHIAMKVGCVNFRTCFRSNFNDVTTSIASKASFEFCFYTDKDYGGDFYHVPAGARISNIGRRYNDTFSSAHKYGFPFFC